MRACVRHGLVHQSRIGGERLEVERAGDVECVEQRLAVRHGQRGETRGERVVVHQHQRLAGCELEIVEEPFHEIGVGREICLADRAEHPDPGRCARVQPVDDELRELGANPRISLREPVGELHHRRAHARPPARSAPGRPGDRGSAAG